MADADVPRDPLEGRSGLLGEMLASLSDDEVLELIAHWSHRMGDYSDGFSRWSASKILSAGLMEAGRRGLPVDDL